VGLDRLDHSLETRRSLPDLCCGFSHPLQDIGVDLDRIGQGSELDGREADLMIVAQGLELVEQPLDGAAEVRRVDTEQEDADAR
jgi:hypothetical protein